MTDEEEDKADRQIGKRIGRSSGTYDDRYNRSGMSHLWRDTLNDEDFKVMELKHVQIHRARRDPFLRIGTDALRIVCEMSQPRELLGLSQMTNSERRRWL